MYLNPAVAQNNPDAMFILGLMYEWGRGVRQNSQRALDLFDRAAFMGQGYAKLEAGGMRMEEEAAHRWPGTGRNAQAAAESTTA
jgi:TPR repeat protein